MNTYRRLLLLSVALGSFACAAETSPNGDGTLGISEEGLRYCSQESTLELSFADLLPVAPLGVEQPYLVAVTHRVTALDCLPLPVSVHAYDIGPQNQFDGAAFSPSLTIAPGETEVVELTFNHLTPGQHTLRFNAVSPFLPTSSTARLSESVEVDSAPECPMQVRFGLPEQPVAANGIPFPVSVTVEPLAEDCEPERVSLLVRTTQDTFGPTALDIAPGETATWEFDARFAAPFFFDKEILSAELSRNGSLYAIDYALIEVSEPVVAESFDTDLDEWQYQNGVPGDRGSHWSAFGGSAAYSFFYEKIGRFPEGTTSSQQTLSRVFEIPALETTMYPSNVYLTWEWRYGYYADNMTPSGSIGATLVPVGDCAGFVDPIPVPPLVIVPGETIRRQRASVDVSDFAFCQMRLVFTAQNRGTRVGTGDREFSGHFAIDDIDFIEASAAPDPTSASCEFTRGDGPWTVAVSFDDVRSSFCSFLSGPGRLGLEYSFSDRGTVERVGNEYILDLNGSHFVLGSGGVAERTLSCENRAQTSAYGFDELIAGAITTPGSEVPTSCFSVPFFSGTYSYEECEVQSDGSCVPDGCTIEADLTLRLIDEEPPTEIVPAYPTPRPSETSAACQEFCAQKAAFADATVCEAIDIVACQLECESGFAPDDPCAGVKQAQLECWNDEGDVFQCFEFPPGEFEVQVFQRPSCEVENLAANSCRLYGYPAGMCVER